MSSKPSLIKYVLLRVVLIVLFVTAFYALLIAFVPVEYQDSSFHITIFFSLQIILIISAYFGAKQVTRELKNVVKYLSGSSDLKNLDSSAHFFTREFENINIKLIKTLQKIKKREKEKRKYTAKIKLKNRQRSDMLSAIAHEFRNPIASIMGYAQTLTDDEDILPKLRTKFLNKIYSNGEKIDELLSRLLLWNRFESGKQKLHFSKFDIKPLSIDIALNLEDRYSREIKIEGNSFKVRADKALIEIVIKNLIENALKYSDEVVRVFILDNRISIVDRGVGISAENIEKVTKKFFRTDEHTWDNSMGLGLAIVKQILKLHNSTLEIESQEGVGSTFSFGL